MAQALLDFLNSNRLQGGLFHNMWQPTNDALAGGQFDPQGVNGQAPQQPQMPSSPMFASAGGLTNPMSYAPIPQNGAAPPPASNGVIPPPAAPQMAAAGGGGPGDWINNNALMLMALGGGIAQGGIGRGLTQAVPVAQQERNWQLQLQTQKASYDAAIANGASPQQAMQFALSGKAAPISQLHEAGTDLMGNKSFIQQNPFTGQISPAVGAGAVASSMGGLSQVPINFGPDGKDEGFMAALEKEDKITAQDVRGVVEGRMPATGRNLQKIMQLATRYDQNFTGAQDFQTRLATAKSFAAGKDAAAVKSFNQALTHAGQIWDLIPKVANTNIGGVTGSVINSAIGEYKSVNPNYQQYQNDRAQYTKLINALAGELRTASTGSGHGSLEEIRNWQKGALASSSGPEMRGSVQGAMDFLHGALEATARKKSEGLKSQFESSSLLSPENAKTFEAIKGFAEGSQNAPTNSAPIKVGSPADAAKLKPGTHYVTPDGKEYVR